MHSRYLIKLRDMTFVIYYLKEAGIAYKYYCGGVWSGETVIDKNAGEIFWAGIKQDKIMVLSQNIRGDVFQTQLDMDKFETGLILKNEAGWICGRLYCGVFGERLILLYNQKNDQGVHKILSRTLNAGAWSEPEKIADFTPIAGSYYKFKNGLLYFVRKDGEKNEIFQKDFKSETRLFSAFGSIIDYSVARGAVLAIVKNSYCCRIIFNGGAGNVLVNEVQKAENCILYYCDGMLYAGYTSNGNLYLCGSANDGRSFLKPVKYNKYFPENAVKGDFINLTESKVCAEEFFSDKYKCGSVLIFGDVVLNENEPRELAEPEPVIKEKAALDDEEKAFFEDFEKMKEIYRLKKEEYEKEGK